MRTRAALIAVGVLVGAYGAWLLLSRQDTDQLLSAALWLAVGPLLHDLLLSAVVVGLAAVGARLLPRSWWAPATVALVVVGSITLAAVPVLGRFGARADNPTLLDRDYVVGWLVLVALVLVGVTLGALLRARRRARPGR